jgi:hypothetical protein
MAHVVVLPFVNVMAAISLPATAPPRSTRTVSCALVHVASPGGLGLIDVADGLADVGELEVAGELLTVVVTVEAGTGVIAISSRLLADESGLPGAADVQAAKAIAAAASVAVAGAAWPPRSWRPLTGRSASRSSTAGSTP